MGGKGIVAGLGGRRLFCGVRRCMLFVRGGRSSCRAFGIYYGRHDRKVDIMGWI